MRSTAMMSRWRTNTMAHIFQYESDNSVAEVSAEELHELCQAALPLYMELDMTDKVQEVLEFMCILEDIIAEED